MGTRRWGAYAHSDLMGNTIENNAGMGGVILNVADGSVVQGNTIRNNGGNYSGGGLFMVNTDAITIVQNLVYGNTSTIGGSKGPGGIFLYPPFSSVGAFRGIVAENTIADGLLLSGNLAQYLVINNIITNSATSVYDAPLQCSYAGGNAITPPSFDHNDVYDARGPGLRQWLPGPDGDVTGICRWIRCLRTRRVGAIS